jgi:hypothetical protein
MTASEEMGPIWLDQQFWKRLNRVERHHERIQSQHETWRRSLARSRVTLNADLRLAWARYCEVIAELERTAGELEMLRIGQGNACPDGSGHEPAFAAGAR